MTALPSNLFDLAHALSARDAALEVVGGRSDVDWIGKALEAGRAVCERLPSFIVDDVQAELARRGVAPPREGRAMGAVLCAMKREALCVGTGEFRPSANPNCHANPRRVWRSLVCGGGQ